MIPSLRIDRPVEAAPRWASLQREYLALANTAPEVIADYLTPEGEILWPDSVKDFQTFAYGNVDNAFEGFTSFPLLYLLGGDDRILAYAQRQYDVLTAQFSTKRKKNLGIPPDIAEKMGRDTMLVDEWFADLDWMHVGEAAMFLYNLVLANPGHKKNRERVLKFTEYTIGENPAGFERNYDPVHKVFKSGYFGTNGPAREKFRQPIYHSHWMDYYGLAFYDVPGVVTYLDLVDKDNAERYGKAYGERLENCDTVVNLMATSLAVNAYMYTGEARYRDFALEYIGAWRKRYEGREIMPDNAGPHGSVGETLGGRFYGSHYGWTHPHGYYFVEDALIIAGENERLLTGARGTLKWARELYDYLVDRYGIIHDGKLLFPHNRADEDSIIEYYGNENTPMTRPDRATDHPGLVRYKQTDGWFSYGSVNAAHLGHIYAGEFDPADAALIEKLIPPESRERVNAASVSPKYKGGQHAAFVRYLEGNYPEYPEEIMEHSIRQFEKQIEILAAEKAGEGAGYGYAPDGDEEWEALRLITFELKERYGLAFDESIVHSYYQTFVLYRTPLSMEGLLNLTMGAMCPIYNGGLIQASFRYFDAVRERPGLPEDVAALCKGLREDGATLTLCNLSVEHAREVIVQGGAYGEHRIESIALDGEAHPVGGKWAKVALGPGTLAILDVKLARYANQPSFDGPFGEKDYLDN